MSNNVTCLCTRVRDSGIPLYQSWVKILRDFWSVICMGFGDYHGRRFMRSLPILITTVKDWLFNIRVQDHTILYGKCKFIKEILNGFPCSIAWSMHAGCCETFGKRKRHEPQGSVFLRFPIVKQDEQNTWNKYIWYWFNTLFYSS